MIKWLTWGGCLAVVGAMALVAAVVHAMGLTKYVVFFGQFVVGLASNPDALPANWVDSDAEVVSITRDQDEHYRDEATIMLRYKDAKGREHTRSFEVYSPSRSLGRIVDGDSIPIEVCTDDPLVVRSSQFVPSEQKECVGEGRH